MSILHQVESVDLAIQLLNDSDYKGCKIYVEKVSKIFHIYICRLAFKTSINVLLIYNVNRYTLHPG